MNWEVWYLTKYGKMFKAWKNYKTRFQAEHVALKSLDAEAHLVGYEVINI